MENPRRVIEANVIKANRGWIWTALFAAAVVSVELLLRHPTEGWRAVSIAAVGAAAVFTAVFVRDEAAWPQFLRWSGILALGFAVGSSGPLVEIASLDESVWAERSRRAMERTAVTAAERLEELRVTATARARSAAEQTAALDDLVDPIVVADKELDVGISLWRADSLLTWRGNVPGPERVDGVGVPLLVDYGYRRYLIVQVTSDDGIRVSCDVDLGVSEELFPRLGLRLSPGDWIAPEFGVALRLWPREPRASDLVDGTVVRPIGGVLPWSWVSLVPPRDADQRRLALQDEGQRVAIGLLLGLLPWIVIAWRAWPGRDVTPRGVAGILVAVSIAFGVRILLERARALDLAFAPGEGTLSLLFLPTYFASSAGGGLLRSTAEFVLTGLLVAWSVVVLVPAWRMLTASERGPWLRTGLWFLLTLGSVGQLAWIESLQHLVVKNANPLLIGLDSPFFTVPFLALHVGMMLVLLPTMVAFFLGWERWFRTELSGWVGLVMASAVIVVVAAAGGLTPVTTVWGVLVPWLGVLAQPALAAPAFSRRVLAGLIALLWLAGVQSTGLERVYNDEKEEVAIQEAEQRLEPLDNWRRFLLEDLIGEIAGDRSLLRELGDPEADRSNLAFEIWARTLLPSQNFGCRVDLRDDRGRLVSEFDIGLPYEPTPLRSWRRDTTLRARSTRVEAIELITEQGPFLVYRGRIDLAYLYPEGDASRLTIDLPYAAAEGSIPLDENVPVGLRLLGERPERDLAPRPTFDEAVMIGYPGTDAENRRVEKSSSPGLVGLAVDDLPAPGEWTRLELQGRSMHVARVERGERALVVAFEEPSAVERLLDLSRLAALYLATAAVGLLFLGLARLLRVDSEHRWPSALGVVGFEERLLGSMLLVVMLPVFLLGVIQERRGVVLSRASNLEEVSDRLDTALQLLARDLDELAEALIRGEYVQEVMQTGTSDAARSLGPFADAQVMIYDPGRQLILDETLSDRTEDEAESYLQRIERGDLLLEVDAFGWFLGRAYPVLAVGDRTFTVYVRRSLVDEDLRRIARTIGVDLTLYDGPWAVVSSQAYLYKAGLRSPILNASALPVMRGGARRVVEAERFGGLVVAQGYGVIAGPDQAQRGALAARLFARATEDARELRRGQMFVFGLSSLALVLAVAAGLALSGRIVGPIRTLAGATNRIARGELEQRVPERGSDEIGQLVRSFNRMTDALARSREQLAARRSFLETVLGSLGAGVLVLDDALRPVERNRAAEALLGDQEERFVDHVRSLGTPDGPVDTEFVLGRDDGPRTLRSVVSPATLESGAPGWLVVFDDVSELLASRRLALYAEMARQVAHEVKNPLTPIQLSAQMVRQATRDDHPRLHEIVDENTATIEAQVERLRSMASEFSLLGRESLDDLGKVEVTSLLQEVRSLYPDVEDGVRIDVHVEEDLDVLASREGLLKVLTNLVENARQAMGGRGRVRLSTRRDGVRVRIEVLDQGPGIPQDVHDRLFEPYFSTKSTGTGLGLVICRSLMEKMGGSIALRNRPDGVGAIAELTLTEARGDGNEITPPA